MTNAVENSSTNTLYHLHRWADFSMIFAFPAIGFACGGWGEGTWQQSDAWTAARTAAQRIVNTPLPTTEGESVIAAMECFKTSSHVLPSNDESVLLGRVSVQKTTYGDKPGIFVSENSNTFRRIGFPKEAVFQSKLGPVVAHNLELATWDGHQFEEQGRNLPVESAPLLKRLGLPTDFNADNYAFQSEWFLGDRLTIVGRVTKEPNGFKITPPANRDSFVVTSHNKIDFINNRRFNPRTACRVGFIASATIFCAGQYLYGRVRDELMARDKWFCRPGPRDPILD